MVREFLEIGFPMYNADRQGNSSLNQVFKEDSDLDTTKRLLNIFVRLNRMDVFKYANYVDRNGRPQEGNSVMQELF